MPSKSLVLEPPTQPWLFIFSPELTQSLYDTNWRDDWCVTISGFISNFVIVLSLGYNQSYYNVQVATILEN